MSQRIDTHQHFWSPTRSDYPWMPEADPILQRPFAPSDLEPLVSSQGVAGTIVVQAAPTIFETEYMLGIADATDFVLGIVGWVDMADAGHKAQLNRLAAHPKFLGVRPMVQDIADDDWILGRNLDWAFSELCALQLTFDALGYPRHLGRFDSIARRYPELVMVVDHCMKPEIAEIQPGDTPQIDWSEGISKLALNENVFCKLSGLITEANANWTIEELLPFASHVIEAFGCDRMIWGSDWPVVTRRCSYEAWVDTTEELLEKLGLSDQERRAIWFENAFRAYRLSPQ